MSMMDMDYQLDATKYEPDESLIRDGMGLVTGISDEERELWKTCDVDLRNRLQGLVNLSYILGKGKDLGVYKNYSDLVERYGRIDVDKLDARFKPNVIVRVYDKLLDMVYMLADYKELQNYIHKELDPLMVEFFTPRYQMFRESMRREYELERKRLL